MKQRHTILFLFFLLFLSKYTSAQQVPSAHLQLAKSSYHLTDSDLAGTVLTHSHTSKKSAVTHFYYQQTLNGVAIRGANMNIHTKGDKVLKTNSSFIKNITKKVKGRPIINAKKALSLTAKHLNISLPTFPQINEKKKSTNQKTTFDHTDIALEPMSAELVYIFNKRKELRLAWEVSLYELSGQHSWLVTLDAESAEIIEQKDRVLHCEFGHATHPVSNSLKEKSCDAQHLCADSPLVAKAAKSNSPTDGSSYKVYPLRVESPTHGVRSIVNEPADTDASPFGWHDTNGAIGAEYNITRGNNVHAYDDFDGSNSTLGDSPSGGSSLDFNFPLNLNNTPNTYIDASITNLFYWNNLMHDVWYQYGFDEASGNYQSNNYGNGGSDGDEVKAEAQDGSGTNNANFSPGVDGASGRMQMYLWNNKRVSFSAGGITYETSGASFGPSTYNSVSGNLVIANDSSDDPTLVCSPLTSASAEEVSGNIALIDRGACNFVVKVANAQAAGAIAVVICSNNNILLNQMGGTDNTITIPSVLIKKSDCAIIRAQIPDIAATFSAVSGQSDSNFDNGIVTHEYGHGISSRLTGGASNSSCLYNEEQAGEGWSDWFGLVMTSKPDDIGTQRRGIGTYAIAQVTTGTGIRSYPYSTDMSINPHTYTDIKTQVVPHGVGSVWCAMIWDLHWDLVDIYGYDNDMYRGTGGNNIAMNLIIEGLKLQPCKPGFVDARDAILLADKMLYNSDNECLIWQTFARRGLGYSASQGSSDSRSDGIEAFDLPPQILGATIIKTSDKTEAYANDIINFTLEISGSICTDVQNVNIVDSLPVGLTYLQGSASNGGIHNDNTITWSTIPSIAKNTNLSYSYKVIVDSNYIAPAWDTLHYDNMENGTENWSISNVSDLSNWTLTTDPKCGTTAWYARELEAGTTTENQYLSTPLSKIGADAELIFTHWYNTEINWDGGTVEISDDGGLRWIDLGPYMTQNGYNDYIKNNPTELAFAGNSNGCIETKIDLSSFSGSTVFIRFNFYYDQAKAGDGWYVDNFYLASNDVVVNTVYMSSDNNTDSDYTGVEIISCTPIELYANLEGSYKPLTNEMTNNLNTKGLLPGQTPISSLVSPTLIGQPYNTAPWNYIGTEGTNWTDANYSSDVVDWVLISIREKLTKNTEIAQAAALLHKDGSIHIQDKCLINTALDKSNLYAVIEHRNHLGIMTPLSIDLSRGILQHDFRIADSFKDATGFGQKELSPGAWGMYSGDIDQSDMPSFDITGQDKSLWITENGKFNFYLLTDINLDGDVNGADKSLWDANNGISSRVPK